MLRSPWISGLSALIVFACGTFVAAGPQVSDGISKRWYVAAALVAVIVEAGRTWILISTSRKLAKATQAAGVQLKLVSQEAVRLAIHSVTEKDEALKDLGVDFVWTARLCSPTRAPLMTLDSGIVGLDSMPVTVNALRRVGKVLAPPFLTSKQGEVLLCASDVQPMTGILFEIFYRWPESEVEDSGEFFGHKMLDRLIRDAMVAYIGTRLAAANTTA